MQWFRFYDDVLDDPKVQRLSAKLFRQWVQILCLANKGSARGRIPKDLEAIAFRLRVRKTDAEMTLSTLVALQLLEETDTHYIPHNWDARQKKSDNSAERVAAHRAKQEEEPPACNVTDPLQQRYGNALDTDTDTEQNREEENRAESALPREAYTTDFLAFMDAYGPTNGPKRPAFAAWKKLGKGDRARAMRALPAWLGCDDWREGFKPYPQKYLNQRFFEKAPVASAGARASPGYGYGGDDPNAGLARVTPPTAEEVERAERHRTEALTRSGETTEERWRRLHPEIAERANRVMGIRRS